MTLTYKAVSSVTLISGFICGIFFFNNGASRFYVFKVYPNGTPIASIQNNSAVPSNGFVCKCTLTGAGVVWVGKSPGNTTNCNSSSGDNLPYSFSQINQIFPNTVPNKPLTANSCCKSKPRVNDTKIPEVPGAAAASC